MKQPVQKSDNELLLDISNKLSQLIAIQGIAGKSDKDQVKYLVNFGFSNSEIAQLTGKPKGTVDGIRATFKNTNSKKKQTASAVV